MQPSAGSSNFLTIRRELGLRCTEETEAEIVQLASQSFPRDFACGDTKSALKEDPFAVLSGFHDAESCEWLLAFRGDSAGLVGLAMSVAYHDSLHVSSLCVLPAHRGCGIGSRLMRSAAAHAAARGLPALSGSVTVAD